MARRSAGVSSLAGTIRIGTPCLALDQGATMHVYLCIAQTHVYLCIAQTHGAPPKPSSHAASHGYANQLQGTAAMHWATDRVMQSLWLCLEFPLSPNSLQEQPMPAG